MKRIFTKESEPAFMLGIIAGLTIALVLNLVTIWLNSMSMKG